MLGGLSSVLPGLGVVVALAWTSGAMANDAPMSSATDTVTQSSVHEAATGNMILAQGQFVCHARDRGTGKLFEATGATLALAQDRALNRCYRRGGTQCFIATCY